MSVQIAKRCFSVGEYYRMAEAGILTEDDRVELIEGEIIEMSPIGSRHAACVDRLNRLFNIRLGQSVIVRVQNPISIDDYSEPEPDVALLRPREDFYDAAHPQPADILLIVEVADTSVEYDRALKVPLYARAGVPEVWLVNLPAERVEIFARPAAGAYPAAREVARGQALVSETVSGLTLNADDILG